MSAAQVIRLAQPTTPTGACIATAELLVELRLNKQFYPGSSQIPVPLDNSYTCKGLLRVRIKKAVFLLVLCSKYFRPLGLIRDLQDLQEVIVEIVKSLFSFPVISPGISRCLHLTAACEKKQAGRYKRSPKGDKPLTYEMAWAPHHIAHTKSWNSWNTSNLQGGIRPAETLFEDVFIRKFMTGTWHNLFLSEIIIKRQHNIIRIAGIVHRSLPPRKFYFLIGYTEELLSYWLQCPVKLELQTVADRKEVVFKYI